MDDVIPYSGGSPDPGINQGGHMVSTLARAYMGVWGQSTNFVPKSPPEVDDNISFHTY